MDSELEKHYQELLDSLSREFIEYLTPLAKDYAFYKAICFRSNGFSNIHVPFTLFPSPFPRHLFEKSKKLQIYMNLLIDKLSCSKEFIRISLKEVSESDDFTKGLIEVYEKSLISGYPQIARATILRTDYMVDDYRSSNGGIELKQVEINTISSSFMSHSCDMNSLHKHNLEVVFNMTKKHHEYHDVVSRIPGNDAITGVAKCIETCHNVYCKTVRKNQSKFSSRTPCVLFIADKTERNSYDQLKIKYRLIELLDAQRKSSHETPQIYFISMSDLDDHTRINVGNGELWYCSEIVGDTEYPVSVVYYRSAYSPSQYPTEKEWNGRLKAEISVAIKIPNIAAHLVGTKKVQQAISEEGMLEKYLKSEEAKCVRETFAELHSLDPSNPNLPNILESALKNPENYVMKPQREGGGNNLYGNEIVEKINEHKQNNQPLSQFILMSLIKPTIYRNYLVDSHHSIASSKNCVSELGIFGTFVVTHSDKVILNDTCGHLVRTKCTEHQDGGVYSGRALLDTPYLI